jgi:hypothetical protein
MIPRSWLATLRIGVGLLALGTVAFGFARWSAWPGLDAVDYLSFFTIQSNLLAGLVLLASGVDARRGAPRDRLAMLRGASTVYMATTGAVYLALLSGQQPSGGVLPAWVNLVFHGVVPLAVVADWIVDPPAQRIARARALGWLAFPVAFVVYTLIRGHLTGWYPYPFLDVARHGYDGVALTSLVLGAAITGVIWLVTWRPRPARRRVAPPI